MTICKGCIEDHLKNCNKQSRVERIISSESYAIDENERKIEGLRNSIASQQAQIKSQQAEINRLESQVAASKERKAQAEAELKDEQPSKKQKSS